MRSNTRYVIAFFTCAILAAGHALAADADPTAGENPPSVLDSGTGDGNVELAQAEGAAEADPFGGDALGTDPLIEGTVPPLEEEPRPPPERRPVLGGGDEGSVMDVIIQERLRRQAEEEHGLQSLAAAELAMKEKDYQTAIRMYLEAEKFIGGRPETADARQRLADGLPEAYYRWAAVLAKRGEKEDALREAREARKRNGHPKASKLIAELERPPDPLPPPKYKPRWRQDDFLTVEKEIDDLLKKGREHYKVDEFDLAREMFERVLKRDAENTEALRYLHKTASRRLDRAEMERETTREDMLYELMDTWNSRDYGLLEQEFDIKEGGRRRTPEDEEAMKEREKMLQKMAEIKIPEIDFRQANIHDVIEFLSESSIEYDDKLDRAEDEKKGVDIILDLGTGADDTAPAPEAELDPFAEEIGGGGGGGAAGDVPLITFRARYISVLEALKIVTRIARLKFSVKGSVVMVVPADMPDSDLFVRTYNVNPAAIDRLRGMTQAFAGGGGGGADDRGDFIAIGGGGGFGGGGGGDDDWTNIFQGLGVEWPRGSQIRYVEGMGKFVVKNTLDNLALFENVLGALDIVPSQIEIEARFVEVMQTDLDSVGFEWDLTDEFELATRKASLGKPLAARERIVATDGTTTLTKGLRFANSLSVADSASSGAMIASDLVRVGSVLTNPELSMVLHALQQKKNTDLLSAPKVTTLSGSEATIKVVTEYIYPTEFTVEPIIGYAGGSVSGSSQPIGAVVEPGSFETREVGVILTVLPEVNPDTGLISLTLAPEVVTEPTWRNYGSQYQTFQTSLTGESEVTTDNMLPMEQPFFHTRSVTTTINIYNEATVMMGGMITENRNEIDDKIPVLGDLPVLGRFFRSRTEEAEKRNLLIFVTARLVDPAGRPLKRDDQKRLEKILTGAVTEDTPPE